MTRLQDLDAVLRTLDAAGDAPPVDARRAAADLEHILSHVPAPTARSVPVLRADAAPAARLHRRRHRAVLGGLAAAVTAGFLVVPALAGGDPAFATWTAAPVILGDAARDDAVAGCLASNEDVGDGMYEADLRAAEVAIAERRGAWTTVVLTGADGFEATCTTDASAAWFRRGMIGSIGRLGAATDPAPRTIVPTQLGMGMIVDEPISMASGRAGTDIAGITYTSIAGDAVVATVAEGQFALWLPGDELGDASKVGVPVQVTYRDGTTGTQTLAI